MKLQWYKDPVTLDKIFTLRITDKDFLNSKLTAHDKFMINELDRENASIEERLMALQIIARRAEEIE